jgi:hypothetical protein
MSETERSANVEPVKLGSASRFKFKCHPGIECFTQCCRRKINNEILISITILSAIFCIESSC